MCENNSPLEKLNPTNEGEFDEFCKEQRKLIAKLNTTNHPHFKQSPSYRRGRSWNCSDFLNSSHNNHNNNPAEFTGSSQNKRKTICLDSSIDFNRWGMDKTPILTDLYWLQDIPASESKPTYPKENKVMNKPFQREKEREKERERKRERERERENERRGKGKGENGYHHHNNNSNNDDDWVKEKEKTAGILSQKEPSCPFKEKQPVHRMHHHPPPAKKKPPSPLMFHSKICNLINRYLPKDGALPLTVKLEHSINEHQPKPTPVTHQKIFSNSRNSCQADHLLASKKHQQISSKVNQKQYYSGSSHFTSVPNLSFPSLPRPSNNFELTGKKLSSQYKKTNSLSKVRPRLPSL